MVLKKTIEEKKNKIVAKLFKYMVMHLLTFVK